MRRTATFITAALLVLAGCSDPQPQRFANVETTSTPAPTSTAVDKTYVDKVLVVAIENKGYLQTRKGAPKLKALGDHYANFNAFKACTHPSFPNYLCMAAGSTFGVTSNSYRKIAGPSILGGTIKAGRSYAGFAESMGSDNCKQSNSGRFAWRHVQSITFKDERTLCEKYVVGFKHFQPAVDAGELANVNVVTGNLCHDGHDCSIGTADNWTVDTVVKPAMAGPDYQSGRLLIIVTADEDDHNEGNRIIGIAIHESLVDVPTITTAHNLYSLHRLEAAFGKTPPLNKGKTAPDMLAALHLTVGGP